MHVESIDQPVQGIVVRRASREDIDQVFEIELASFRIPYPRHLLRAYLEISGDYFLVATAAGKVVGYAIGVVEKGRLGHVISLAVRPEWRRRGIGRALLNRLIELMADAGAEAIYLEVRKSNTAAIKLYKKLGFKEVCVVHRYYPDGEDAIVMVLRLA